MFKPFRRRRHADPASPPDSDQHGAEFDRAWADYVEWSGLDEAGLPDSQEEREG